MFSDKLYIFRLEISCTFTVCYNTITHFIWFCLIYVLIILQETNMRSEALTTVATAITFQERDIFFLERFVSLFFVISTSSYANFWGGIFCLFRVQYLIFFALRLDYNFCPPLSTTTKNTRGMYIYICCSLVKRPEILCY